MSGSFSVGAMKFLAWFRIALSALLLAGMTGCAPSGQSQTDEEKEPHFLEGRNCINSMDYPGAVEKFEQAIEVNPHSAAAHFQLGWLYEEKVPDAAAAIYHFQQFLKLRPNSDNAEVIKQHINNCKQDLAKTVLPLPVTPGMQRQFEQLAEENKRLKDELEQWKGYAARLQTLTGQLAQASASLRTPSNAQIQSVQQNPGGSNAGSATRSGRQSVPIGATRTYNVQSGDSLYSIAKKYGVRLDALKAANPNVDPNRLRIGQSLNVPSP